MANPQKENGYTAIANEILEALYKTPFNGTEFRIINVILRFTYGFSRKSHSLSESFISDATDIDKRNVRRELTGLIESKIVNVVKEATFTSSREIEINKNYEEWRKGERVKLPPVGKKALTPEGEITHSPEGEFTPQESNIKTNIKTNMYDLLFESFWKEYPRKLGKGEAYKTWKTRLKEKHSPDELILAAKNYASLCKKKGTEVDYIKHPKTFLSKTTPWKDYLLFAQDKLEEESRYKRVD